MMNAYKTNEVLLSLTSSSVEQNLFLTGDCHFEPAVSDEEAYACVTYFHSDCKSHYVVTVRNCREGNEHNLWGKGVYISLFKGDMCIDMTFTKEEVTLNTEAVRSALRQYASRRVGWHLNVAHAIFGEPEEFVEK